MQALRDENISEYKPRGTALIKDLIAFASDFKEEEDEPNALEKIRHVALSNEAKAQNIQTLEEELERLIKMFYLHMRVQGKLNPFKEDYFV